MENHRGKYIENLIKESEFTITEVADFIGKGRSTLHRWLANPNLSLKKMLMVSESINKDITLEYPNAQVLLNQETVQEAKETYSADNLTTLTKYTNLLEDHTKILKDYARVKRELGEVRLELERLKNETKTGQ